MLENKKIIISIINFFLFSVVSSFNILFSFYVEGNLILEIFRWINFTSLALIFVSIFIEKKIFSIIINTFFYFLNFLLIFFKLKTNYNLDYSFLKRNIYDFNIILDYFFFEFLFLLILAFINAYLISKINLKKNKKKYLLILSILLSLILLPLISIFNKYNNPIFRFLETINTRNKVINYYEKNIYKKLIKENIEKKEQIISEVKNIKKENINSYLENIIILQIESLNSELVKKEITPNLLEISRQGVLFEKFYNNSVQTILGQENILCSLPTSFNKDLVDSKYNKKILCLGEILNEMDYKTFFIKSFRLGFKKTGKFINNLGFDEIHADDIMKDSDPKYKWGYREDVFLKRALDYFSKEKKDKYNFLYIEIGPTNHWPFKTPKEYLDIVPFKDPKNHREEISNTTFLQDLYLKDAYKKINKIFPEKNYILFILSDHSWPIEIHKGNIFNQDESFEENFLSSMVMVLGNESKYKNKIIKNKYSQMDIMSSILEMFDIKFSNNFSSSFAAELNNQENNINKKILLIQPFSKKYINIIDSDLKYQYNQKDEKILLFDLKKDPLEGNPNLISENEDDNLKIIKSIVN